MADYFFSPIAILPACPGKPNDGPPRPPQSCITRSARTASMSCCASAELLLAEHACRESHPRYGDNVHVRSSIATSPSGTNQKADSEDFFADLQPFEPDHLMRQAMVTCWMMMPRSGGREVKDALRVVPKSSTVIWKPGNKTRQHSPEPNERRAGNGRLVPLPERAAGRLSGAGQSGEADQPNGKKCRAVPALSGAVVLCGSRAARLFMMHRLPQAFPR